MPISGSEATAVAGVTGDSPARSPSAVLAGLRALLVGLVPLVALHALLWVLADAPGTLLAAARVGALDWALALGAPLTVGDVRVGVVPLGITALLAVPLWRAGRRLATQPVPRRARLVLALAATFGGGAAAVSALAATEGVAGSPLRAAVGGLLLALLTAGCGARSRRTPPAVADPPARAAVVRGGLVAAATLFAGGALLTAGAVAASVSDVVAAGSRLGGGPGPLFLQLAFAPDAVVWGTAFLLGPGVAIGAGSTLSPFGVGVPHLLPLPLVAAIPEAGYAPGFALLSLVVPLLAGVAAARVLLARLPEHGLSTGRAACLAALCGPCAAVPVGVLAYLSSGPAGTEAVGDVGPSALATGLACALEVGAAAAVAAALAVATRPVAVPAPTAGTPAAP